MRDLGDVAAQGRACGNLGNTHYLLGDFAQAVRYHEERLSIARQFGDKAAERRAHSNLGNSHIFMGQFEEAAHHYKYLMVHLVYFSVLFFVFLFLGELWLLRKSWEIVQLKLKLVIV